MSVQPNTAGSHNQFSGYYSGSRNATGTHNLFLGYLSGAANTTGTNNTALSYNAGPGTWALTNAAAIGNRASVLASNTIVLGNAEVTALRCPALDAVRCPL